MLSTWLAIPPAGFGSNTSHRRHSGTAGKVREPPASPTIAVTAKSGSSKKGPPPEQTHAENFYYQKQMQGRTPMVFVLQDGEEVRGIIEWYDRDCIKVTRNGYPGLLIYKPCIKYMFKESDNGRNRNG